MVLYAPANRSPYRLRHHQSVMRRRMMTTTTDTGAMATLPPPSLGQRFAATVGQERDEGALVGRSVVQSAPTSVTIAWISATPSCLVGDCICTSGNVPPAPVDDVHEPCHATVAVTGNVSPFAAVADECR
jgi:hypothetical protein